MKLQRTGNAGILLEMDGTRLLLDGICHATDSFMGTPAAVLQELTVLPPDALLFTHAHGDHYAQSLVSEYGKTVLRPVYGPEDVKLEAFSVGSLSVTPISTRHLGKAEPGLVHTSYRITGEKTLLFVGDAAPVCWRNHPKVDVAVVPFGYCTTEVAWQMTKALCDQVVLVHMPSREKDIYGLWQTVSQTLKEDFCWILKPEIGQWLHL